MAPFFGPSMNDFTAFDFAGFTVAFKDIFVDASGNDFSTAQGFPVAGIGQYSGFGLTNADVAFPVTYAFEFIVQTHAQR